jgi:membrane protease YdiL (CAAX protease family)
VVFGWLYQRTGGSLWSAIVAHAGAHLNNTVHALPAHPETFVSSVLGTCVAAALALCDRRAWCPYAEEPRAR